MTKKVINNFLDGVICFSGECAKEGTVVALNLKRGSALRRRKVATDALAESGFAVWGWLSKGDVTEVDIPEERDDAEMVATEEAVAGEEQVLREVAGAVGTGGKIDEGVGTLVVLQVGGDEVADRDGKARADVAAGNIAKVNMRQVRLRGRGGRRRRGLSYRAGRETGGWPLGAFDVFPKLAVGSLDELEALLGGGALDGVLLKAVRVPLARGGEKGLAQDLPCEHLLRDTEYGGMLAASVAGAGHGSLLGQRGEGCLSLFKQKLRFCSLLFEAFDDLRRGLG